MNKHLSKKSLWPSLLSLMALAIFVLLAIGSLGEPADTPKIEHQYLADGVLEETEILPGGYKVITTTGKVDGEDRWNDSVTIVNEMMLSGYETRERVLMVHGIRHGRSRTTYNMGGGKIDVEYTCYNMGKVIPCEKSTRNMAVNTSAYEILSSQYPWFFSSLNVFGFDSSYVAAYLDTLVTVLNTYEFDESEFDDYYDDAETSIMETPWDSIISLNSDLTYCQGLEELKNFEFRLAVITHYRTEGSTTYDIISTIYPGYLLTMNEAGITNHDFEVFCENMDDSLTSYGPLDQEDPSFIDSVDSRIFRALFSIITDTTTSPGKRAMRTKAVVSTHDNLTNMYQAINSLYKSFRLESDPTEVGTVVFFMMWIQYFQGDIIRRSVREAWLNEQGIIQVPTVTTVFATNNSATSVTLEGSVIEDGGAAVTSRGIAWATFYNPTTGDNTATPAIAADNFAVTLTGLSESTTYYARAYATNSAGTAYGNCISFSAFNVVGIDEQKMPVHNFTIYPNPASASVTLCFQVSLSKNLTLLVTDAKGQEIMHRNLDCLPLGENRIELNLTGLLDGMYSCQLLNGTKNVTQKLIIAHYY